MKATRLLSEEMLIITEVGAGTYAMVKQGKLTVSANYNYNYNNSPRSYSDSYRENYEPDKENEKYLESEVAPSRKGISSMAIWKLVTRLIR